MYDLENRCEIESPININIHLLRPNRLVGKRSLICRNNLGASKLSSAVHKYAGGPLGSRFTQRLRTYLPSSMQSGNGTWGVPPNLNGVPEDSGTSF